VCLRSAAVFEKQLPRVQVVGTRLVPAALTVMKGDDCGTDQEECVRIVVDWRLWASCSDAVRQLFENYQLKWCAVP